MNHQTTAKGSTILQTMFVLFVAILLIVGFTSFATYNVRAARYQEKRELALQLAESGVNYYRWHLAHAATDYQDGTTSTGPYIHQVKDKNGNLLGTFSLEISPAATGSSIVSIQATGQPANESSIKRKIKAVLAIPSFSQYAVAANANLRFGSGTETYGPIHSNGGIRFDAVAHGIITSAVASYNDPDHYGGNEFGVHTHTSPIDPLPPNSVPNRSDVFMAGRKFPVPILDFPGLTGDLGNLKTIANSTSGKYFAHSGSLGYHIVLKNNGTYDIYKVNRLEKASGGCSNELWQDDWGTWSMKSTNGEEYINNYAYPSNGIIFVEDNLWIDGQVNNNRLTIAAARFPDTTSTRTSITINQNLTYTYYDGRDVVGLIAQKNINVGLFSNNDLKIDAAAIAQYGRVGRYYYGSGCGQHNKNRLELVGMIGTFERYGFAYTDGTGYKYRDLYYDSNLMYAPPPHFPLAADHYQIISWEELPN